MSITSTGSGNWTSTTPNAPWPGGAVPTATDAVTIGRSATCTFTAATDRVNKTAHGLVDGDMLYFQTTGTLGGGLALDTLYYVVNKATDYYQVSLTAGGVAVDITSAGTGTNTYFADAVTMNATGLVALSVELNGTLTCSASASSDLTVQTSFLNTSTFGNLLLDISSDGSKNCQIFLNNSNNATSQGLSLGVRCRVYMKGAAKTRWTTTTGTVSVGATSCTVSDATGWRTGDRIVFCTTDAYSATPHIDVVTNITVSGNNISWTGGLTYGHLSGCYVGNFTSNLRIAPANSAYKAFFSINSQYATHSISDIECSELYGNTASPNAGFTVTGTAGNASWSVASNNAFYNTSVSWYGIHPALVPKSNNIYLMHSSTGAYLHSLSWTNSYSPTNGEDDSVFFGGTGSLCSINSLPHTANFNRLKISGYAGATTGALNTDVDRSTTFYDCEIWSCINALQSGYQLWGDLNFVRGKIGTSFSGAINHYIWDGGFPTRGILTDTVFDASQTAIRSNGLSSWGDLQYLNKQADVTAQEIYTNEIITEPTFSRDNTITHRSNASLKIFGTTYGVSKDREITTLVPAGATIHILGYCQVDSNFYNGGTWYPPTVVISSSGTVLQTYTATSAANGAWEAIDISATNSAGTPKVLTITFRANRRGSSGYCWFDGTPMYPFVTQCRHYGYLFDETSPTRTVNVSVSANEATAAAITGIAVTGSTSAIAITASRTFQQLHDSTQAWSCLNLAYSVPITGSGVAGSVSLFAVGNISISDGYVLNGSGSISMGSHTLSTEFASGVNYTFTGGTWSQLTTVPTFDGGQVNLGAAGTYVFSATSSILSMTPTSPSTYAMGGGTFTGTIDLRNTTANAITVEVPSGTTTTTANNTGGTITVSAPVESTGIDFSGVVTGSTVKVFATGTQTVIATPTSPTWLWSETYSADQTVDYTIQLAGYLPIRVTGVLAGNTVLSIAVQQIIDRAYVASTGLTFGTNCYAAPATGLFGLTTASTLQNFYARMIESWITEATLQNKTFPLSANGPNSFSLADWAFDLTTYPNSITNLSRDGMRYLASGVVTATWAAILSVGVPTGKTARFQQTDGGTTVNADNTGEIDQLVQIYGDASHGNFNHTDWLVLKLQGDGYDQAEFDAIATYTVLEDQLYVAGLAPTPNGIAAGTVTGVTITDHGASPVTWNGKAFSITITDTTSHTGEQIVQYVRGLDEFDYHDLVRTNGTKYKTVRGAVYGDVGAALKGVRVVQADGTTAHADFDLFTADDGTTYSPPVVADVTATVLANTRVVLYNVTQAAAIDNAFVAATSYSYTITTEATAGDILALHYFKEAYQEGSSTMVWGGVTAAFVVSQAIDPVITAFRTEDSITDYTTITEYNAYSPTIYIQADDADGVSKISRLAIFYNGMLTTAAGASYFRGGMSMLSTAAVRINKSVINLFLENVSTTLSLRFSDETTRRIYTDDGTSIIAPSSVAGSIEYAYGGVPDVVSIGGINIITGDIADIPAAPSAASVAAATLAAAQSAPICADVQAGQSSVADAVWAKTLP